MTNLKTTLSNSPIEGLLRILSNPFRIQIHGW